MTAFMRAARGARPRPRAARCGAAYQWVPYPRISPHLKRAVLVAEDSAFWDHEGIDIEQIRESIETAIEKGDTPRGASTITQQLAKNLYLSPSRDPLRKVRELIITRRLEAALPKARILELYLNVVEWGDGIWGAEAAARRYFGVSASALTRAQAALLAGALINPVRYSPGHPPARLLRRQQIILSRMGSVEPPVPPPSRLPESDEPVPQEVQDARAADAAPTADDGEAAPPIRRGVHASGAQLEETSPIRCAARRGAAATSRSSTAAPRARRPASSGAWTKVWPSRAMATCEAPSDSVLKNSRSPGAHLGGVDSWPTWNCRRTSRGSAMPCRANTYCTSPLQSKPDGVAAAVPIRHATQVQRRGQRQRARRVQGRRPGRRNGHGRR